MTKLQFNGICDFVNLVIRYKIGNLEVLRANICIRLAAILGLRNGDVCKNKVITITILVIIHRLILYLKLHSTL
jgi:hypothetical protein